MGRKKIAIKPIAHPSTRRATFEKRRIGLLKKAMELSILCKSTVSLTVYTSEGDVYIYSSEPYENVISKFQNYRGAYRLLTNDHLSELVPGKSSSNSIGYEIIKQPSNLNPMMNNINTTPVTMNMSPTSLPTIASMTTPTPQQINNGSIIPILPNNNNNPNINDINNINNNNINNINNINMNDLHNEFGIHGINLPPMPFMPHIQNMNMPSTAYGLGESHMQSFKTSIISPKNGSNQSNQSSKTSNTQSSDYIIGKRRSFAQMSEDDDLGIDFDVSSAMRPWMATINGQNLENHQQNNDQMPNVQSDELILKIPSNDF